MLPAKSCTGSTYESPIAAPLVKPNSFNSADASEASVSSRELIARDAVKRKEKNKDKRRSRCEAILATEVEPSEEKVRNRG